MTKKQLQLIYNYYKRGLTLRQIGAVIGMTGAGVFYYLKKNNLPLRSSGVLRQSLKIDTKQLLSDLKREWEG